MKIKQTVRLCLLFLVLFALGCKKDLLEKSQLIEDNNIQDPILAFTSLPANADNDLKLIVANILSTEERTPFLRDYARINGYPVWDKVYSNEPISGSSSGGEITIKSSNSSGNNKNGKKSSISQKFFLIPLIDKKTKEVKSYIACEKKNDSAFIFRTYNKAAILEKRTLDNGTQDINTKALLAGFAFFENRINGKKSSSFFSKNKEYKFSDVKFTRLNPNNKQKQTSIENKVSVNLSSDCERHVLDYYYIDYSDGTWDLVLILSDCMTLPGVTVVASPRAGGGGGSNPYSGGYTGPLPGGTPYTGGVYSYGSDPYYGTGNYSGGGYTGSYDPNNPPTGWVDNPLDVYWASLTPSIGEIHSPTVKSILYLLDDGTMNSEQLAFLNNNEIIAQEILNFLVGEDVDESTIITAKIFIDLNRLNLFYGDFDANYFSVVDQYLQIGPSAATKYMLFIMRQTALYKIENPDWSYAKCWWEAVKESVHIGLDILALWPAGGQIFDVFNGFIYSVEGNATAARLSFISAMIPAGGWFVKGFKHAKLTLQIGSKKTNLVWTLLTNGIVHFGNRRQLRTVLGLTDSRQAHHLIPWEFIENSVVQKAAKSSKSFHMNEALNGIPLSKSIHVEGRAHTAYNARVAAALNAIEARNLNADDTYDELMLLISRIRTAIINHPGVHLNDIIF